LIVSPPVLTMYTLTAANSSSSTTKTAYIVVIPANQSVVENPAAPTWLPT
jgi:hypothetical protein